MKRTVQVKDNEVVVWFGGTAITIYTTGKILVAVNKEGSNGPTETILRKIK